MLSADKEERALEEWSRGKGGLEEKKFLQYLGTKTGCE